MTSKSDTRVTSEDTHLSDLLQLHRDIEALSLALAQMGVLVREEALPDVSAGGLARVGQQRLCFLPQSASLATKRATLVDALRRLPHEDVFLHPRLRSLIED